MPYVVTSVKPRKRKVDLLDFLDYQVTADMVKPPSRYEFTGTRTYYYNDLVPKKDGKKDILECISWLEEFYSRYSSLDVCNNHPDYNYELQLELIKAYKRTGMTEEEAINECKKDLNDKGYKYFNLYTTFWVPKNSSKPGNMKWRRIDSPCDRLSKCLRQLKAMLEYMMDGCFYHTAAFAYIPGRSAKDAVKKHANNKSNWFLKLDFSNFFGSTTIEFVLNMLSEIFPFSEIVKVKRGEEALRNCLNLGFLNGGLPQGTPLSPTLTNIMMIGIDYKINKALRENKAMSPSENELSFVYTRYADDMTISNRIKFDKDEVIRLVKDILTDCKAPFEINNTKTQFRSNAGSNWILGLMLNQEHNVTVGYKRKKLLKATLTRYMTDRANGFYWEPEEVEHLQGEIAYCHAIEPGVINHILSSYSSKFGDIKGAMKSDLKYRPH